MKAVIDNTIQSEPQGNLYADLSDTDLYLECFKQYKATGNQERDFDYFETKKDLMYDSEITGLQIVRENYDILFEQKKYRVFIRNLKVLLSGRTKLKDTRQRTQAILYV